MVKLNYLNKFNFNKNIYIFHICLLKKENPLFAFK